MKKTIYVLSLLMSLLIISSCAADKLTVTPTEVQIGTTKSQTFSVHGGEEPYIWQVIGKGSLDIDSGNTVKYTATKSSGENRLVVMDSKGLSAEVNIAVTGTLDAREPIQVTPDVDYMKRGETKSFTIISGVPPYTAIVVDGDGTLSPGTQSDDGRFTYTAGNVADKDIIIQFSDHAGQTVHAHAYVEREIRLTSGSILYVDKGSKAKFKISGGTAGYYVLADVGLAEIDPETGLGTYTAPNRYGEYTLTVIDSSDQTKEFVMKVERMVPVILP